MLHISSSIYYQVPTQEEKHGTLFWLVTSSRSMIIPFFKENELINECRSKL